MASISLHQARLIGWGDTTLGIIGGLLSAALLPLLLFRVELGAHLAFVFRISALLLSYLALDMVVSGLLELGAIVGWNLADGEEPGNSFSQGMLVAMLMLVPIYFIVRDWWTEAEEPEGRRTSCDEAPPRS